METTIALIVAIFTGLGVVASYFNQSRRINHIDNNKVSKSYMQDLKADIMSDLSKKVDLSGYFEFQKRNEEGHKYIIETMQAGFEKLGVRLEEVKDLVVKNGNGKK